MKMEIGSVLKFDASGFDRTMGAWEQLLVPINEALVFYNSLCIGLATQNEYDDMINGRYRKLVTKYLEEIRRQLSKSKITVAAVVDEALRNAEDQIEELQKMVEKIFERRLRLPADIQVQLDHAVITMGMAVLSDNGKQEIRKYYTNQIENEKQVEFYQLVEELSDAYSRVRAFWNENTVVPLAEHENMIGEYQNNILSEAGGIVVLDVAKLQSVGAGQFNAELNRFLNSGPVERQLSETEILAGEGEVPEIINRRYRGY